MSLPNDIVTIGAGGHAKVLIATVRAAGGNVAAACDDDQSRWGQELRGVHIRGPIAEEAIGGAPALIAIGDDRTREAIADRLRARWVTACYPSAVRVDQGSLVGVGTSAAPNVVVGPRSTVGAGGVCFFDVAAKTTVAGVPGRAIEAEG